jgi:hypothetical protein
VRKVSDGQIQFRERVRPVIERFFAQNGQQQAARRDVDALTDRLWSLVGERGLPPPLPVGAQGTPSEMTEEDCAPLVARVLGNLSDPLWRDVAKQFVKACFYPEFKVCRDSFCEVAEGACRRQELARAKKRTSGSHSVDCPYWVGLTPEQHARLLAQNWHYDVAEFRAHRDVFLPEDFRALRRFVRTLAAERSQWPGI